MDFSEFRLRLGADPYCREPEMQTARGSGPEFEAAAREAADFENRLQDAMQVPVDRDALLGPLLATRQAGPRTGTLALAASVVAAIAAALVWWSLTRVPATLPEYLAQHYGHDGAEVLSRVGQGQSGDITTVLARFGVSAAPALADRIGYIKICPSLHGKGAHMIVHTDEGWVTVLYLPGVSVEEGRLIPVDGEQARMLAMADGAAAIIAPNAAADDELAELLHQSLTPVANDA